MNPGGFLGGLGGLITKLAELADRARELKSANGTDQDIKVVSGFTIRTGLGRDGGGDDFKVEPFGNVKEDRATGRAVVQESREPIVDVFDEADHLLVVVELPGVSAEDVRLELRGDVLTLEAAHGERKYRKEERLPVAPAPEGMTFACRNGVLEVRLAK